MSLIDTPFTRRHFLASSASLPLVFACRSSDLPSTAPPLSDAMELLSRLEQATEGRMGVAAINLATGTQLSHRPHERFAMCSTFKWLLAAVVLQRVDQGVETLDRPLSWTTGDLVTWSPVTQPLTESRQEQPASLTVGQLCLATMRTSDNTAANVLLRSVGGPTGFTRSLRDFGDKVTRLDRWETALNANTPGDLRDTSTPSSMLWLMQHLLYGSALSDASRQQLKRWLMANETGRTRLRAGLPTNWVVGDRTGTSTHNANNNVAFAEAPSNAERDGPLLIVSFTNAPNPTKPAANVHHANVARVVFNALIQRQSNV